MFAHDLCEFNSAVSLGAEREQIRQQQRDGRLQRTAGTSRAFFRRGGSAERKAVTLSSGGFFAGAALPFTTSFSSGAAAGS